MNSHLRCLRQLIADGMYLVDEPAVADAVLARAGVRAIVANAAFRCERQAPPVRSFHRDDGARSFRLERRSRLHAYG